MRGATEALRLTEERMRLLIDAVRDYAIFMVDPDGRVASWNAGAERITGYAAEEIVGKHLRTFYTEADRSSGHAEEKLRRALAEGRYEEEGWRVRKDKSRFWCSVVLTAISPYMVRYSTEARMYALVMVLVLAFRPHGILGRSA